MIDPDYNPYDIIEQHNQALENLMNNQRKLEHYINILAESQRQQALLLEQQSQQNTQLILDYTQLLTFITQGQLKDGQATDNSKVRRST